MPARPFSQQLAVLATLLEPTRERLYRHVAAERGAVGRDAAARSVGISRAMAAFHLDRLVEVGLLRAEFRRLSGRSGRGAGRPAKLYRRSRHRFAAAVPERDHELLARLMIEPLDPSRAPTGMRAAAHRYGHLLGARARRGLRRPTDEDRLAGCVTDIAGEIGFEPTPGAANETWMRNCPFDPLSRESPGVVCQTAIEIMKGAIEAVGTEGVEIRRHERSDWCCVVLTRAGAPVLVASPKTATDM